MAADIKAGDVVILRKKHPCGGDAFRLTRVGADCRAVCQTCGAAIEMSRRNFEKAVRGTIPEPKHVEKK